MDFADQFSPAYSLDSSLGVQTPEGIEYTLYPAGIPARACAWGIDFLVKSFALLAVLIILAVTGEALGIWLFFVLSFALNWFYFTFFELLWNGQSPGKRVLGLRVVGSDGSPVKAGASFLRNLLRFADGFFFLHLIAFISMAASPGFRRLGDWAGDTLVVYTARSRLSGRFSPALRSPDAVPWLKDIPPVVPGFKLSYEEKQALLMFARRYPLLGRARADEIARPWTARLRADEIRPDVIRQEPTAMPGETGEVSEARGISCSEYLLGIAHTISGVS